MGKDYINTDSLGDWCFEGRRKWVRGLFCYSKNMLNMQRLCINNAIAFSLVIHLLVILSGDIHENPGPNNWTDVSICHVNIRSLRGDPDKLDQIACGLGDKYDIITISETWLTSSCQTSRLTLPGFQLPHRKDRPNDHGYGGVLVWPSIKLVAKQR